MSYKTINDIYYFECSKCANCCTGDTQILLDFYDLYKMGRFLNLRHSGQLFKRNYVFMTQTENEMWRPQLRFKTKPFSFCPFLTHQMDEMGKIGGLCRLHHRNKPLVCASAPIGRRYDFRGDTIEYIFHSPAPDCPGMQSNKINHVGDLDKEYEKEFLYQEITFRILENIPFAKITKEAIKKLFSFPINDDFDSIFNKIKKSVGLI